MRYLLFCSSGKMTTQDVMPACYFLKLIVYPILTLTKNGVLDMPTLLACEFRSAEFAGYNIPIHHS